MDLPATRLSKVVDPALRRIAQAVGVVWVVLMAVIVINVVARYLFSQGRIEFEELQWHLYSAGFMLTLGWALIVDAHIRVDVVHERFSERVQLWIDFYGYLLFVVPFCVLMIWYGWDFFLYSFKLGEVSASPGGLPYRWFIKAFLVVGFALLLLATLSRVSRILARLSNRGN